MHKIVNTFRWLHGVDAVCKSILKSSFCNDEVIRTQSYTLERTHMQAALYACRLERLLKQEMGTRKRRRRIKWAHAKQSIQVSRAYSMQQLLSVVHKPNAKQLFSDFIALVNSLHSGFDYIFIPHSVWPSTVHKPFAVFVLIACRSFLMFTAFTHAHKWKQNLEIHDNYIIIILRDTLWPFIFLFNTL